MTFENLVEANKLINTTPIKGKQYAEVPQRIKAFRFLYPDGAIETEMIYNDGGVCIFRATVSADGKVLGTGTAYEKEGSSNINRTSYIENCETSAVGRALGMCGFGIDASIASYEEVATAIMQQEEQAKIDDVKIKALRALIAQKGQNDNAILKYFKISKFESMTMSQFNFIVMELEKLADKEA